MLQFATSSSWRRPEVQTFSPNGLSIVAVREVYQAEQCVKYCHWHEQQALTP